jgi:uncharacterized Fe-S radical SAM superfamily protein PflX
LRLVGVEEAFSRSFKAPPHSDSCYECKYDNKHKHSNMRTCLTEAEDMLKTHTGLYDDCRLRCVCCVNRRQ